MLRRDMCHGWRCQFLCDEGKNRLIGGLKLKVDLLDKNILGVCLK